MARIQETKNTEFVQNDQDANESNETFSPRTVAKSLGVSESSLKRWCDAGYLNAFKTAGGHRRISRPEVISFVKRKKIKLIKPETIGLPVLDDVVIENPADGVNQFYDALMSPDDERSTKLLLSVFMQGWEVAEMIDQIVSPAFERIGAGWHEGRTEVYQERQACLACLESIRQLSSILPSPALSAPSAMGGAIENDHYDVPTQALEVTMVSLGWRAISLGSNLPLESLLNAAKAHTPDLFWLSISHLENSQQTIVALNEFASAIPAETTLVIGGFAIDANIRGQIKHAIFCDNFSQLAALVRKFQPSLAAPSLSQSVQQ